MPIIEYSSTDKTDLYDANGRINHRRRQSSTSSRLLQITGVAASRQLMPLCHGVDSPSDRNCALGPSPGVALAFVQVQHEATSAYRAD